MAANFLISYFIFLRINRYQNMKNSKDIWFYVLMRKAEKYFWGKSVSEFKAVAILIFFLNFQTKTKGHNNEIVCSSDSWSYSPFLRTSHLPATH